MRTDATLLGDAGTDGGPPTSRVDAGLVDAGSDAGAGLIDAGTDAGGPLPPYGGPPTRDAGSGVVNLYGAAPAD